MGSKPYHVEFSWVVPTPRMKVGCRVCWSILECVEVCRSLLECFGVCLSVMQCVGVCCNVLKCVGVFGAVVCDTCDMHWFVSMYQ